jgi:hypothetical protein
MRGCTPRMAIIRFRLYAKTWRLISATRTGFVFSHVIVEELGEQNALRSVLALDKALHQEPRLNPSRF